MALSDDVTAHYKLKNSFIPMIIFKQFNKRAVHYLPDLTDKETSSQ